MMAGQQPVPRVCIVAALDPMDGDAAHRLGRRARAGARAVNGCHGPGLPQPPRKRQPRGVTGPVRRIPPHFGLALARLYVNNCGIAVSGRKPSSIFRR